MMSYLNNAFLNCQKGARPHMLCRSGAVVWDHLQTVMSRQMHRHPPSVQRPTVGEQSPPPKGILVFDLIRIWGSRPPASHLILPVPLGCCCVSRCGLHYSCSLSMDSSSTAFPVPVFNRFLLYDRIWKLLSFVNYVTLSDLTQSPLLL